MITPWLYLLYYCILTLIWQLSLPYKCFIRVRMYMLFDRSLFLDDHQINMAMINFRVKVLRIVHQYENRIFRHSKIKRAEKKGMVSVQWFST